MNKIIVNRDTMHWYGEPPCVPLGQQLFSQFNFSLSEDWDGATIIAQFKQGNTILNIEITNNSCFVPYGLSTGTVYVRLRGTFAKNDTIIATANELQFCIVQGFESGGSPSVPPTPDLYQTLLNKVQTQTENIDNLTTKAAASAEQAEAAAKEAAGSAQASETAAEAAGKSAESAEGSSTSAEEDAAKAEQSAATAQAAAEKIREALENYYPKPQTLSEQTAALYGLGADATPNDVLSILAGLALPQIKVTAPTGSTVICTNGTKTLTAAEQGGVWTFRASTYGTWTVTATKDGLTTEERVIVDAVKQYSVSLEYFSANFAENTWAQIAKASAAGTASQLWSVGDTKDITVSGETLTLVIMGFDHDDLASGGKAGITLGLKNLMDATRSMNSSNTNIGGFAGSEMYSWLQDTLLPAMPSDLQTVIKSVNKQTSAGSRDSTINTDAMKLFLFSEIEIFGLVYYSAPGEGSQYEYFAANTKVKYANNGAGGASPWWERSPSVNSLTSFCNVVSSGTYNDYYADSERRVCFGFCV